MPVDLLLATPAFSLLPFFLHPFFLHPFFLLTFLPPLFFLPLFFPPFFLPPFFLLGLAALPALGAPPSWLAFLAWSAPAATLPSWATVLSLLPVLYVACATPFLVAFDLRHRRLPNVIVLPGIALTALCAATAALLAHTDPGGTALVAAVTLLVFATFRLAGALASGDVKLAVLLAATLAPIASASLTVYALAGGTSALTAGLAALLLLARTRRRTRRLSPAADRRVRVRPGRRVRLRRPARTALSVSGVAETAASPSGVERIASSEPGDERTAVSAAGAERIGGDASVATDVAGRDIPLGPFLLLGFWVAAMAALLFPPP